MNTTSILNTLAKWQYVLRYWASLAGSSVFFTISLQLSSIINTFLVVFVWFIGTSNSYLVSYLLLGRIYRIATNNQWHQRFGSDIIMGNISKQLLYPQNYFFNYFIASIGFRTIRTINLLVTLVFVVATFHFFIIPLKLDGNYFGLLLFAPLSFVMNYILSIFLGSFCFYLKDKRDYSGMSEIYETFSTLFIGTIVPLDKLPNQLSFLHYSPFAWLLNYPLKIYLGEFNNLQIVQIFCLGLLWCVALYTIAILLFKRGLRHNESLGL
jgi:ABC-2 type transport system permease protein